MRLHSGILRRGLRGLNARALRRSCAMLAAAGAIGVGCGEGVEAGAAGRAAASRRTERALPRFSGELLSGEVASTAMFHRRRAILFLFSSSSEDSEAMAGLVKAVQPDASRSNVAIAGISRDLDPGAARRFLRLRDLDITAFDDRTGSISAKLGVPGSTSAILVVDAEGYIVMGFAGIEKEMPASTYQTALREALHLSPVAGAADPALGLRPQAPAFEVSDLSGGTLDLEALSEKVVVLVLFLPTCPHCHHALQFLDRLRRQLGHDDLAIVPVSLDHKKYVIEDMVERLGLDLPIYLDRDKSVRQAYTHGGSVPDTIIIDRAGRVAYRHGGMAPRIEALITMEIREELAIDNPILLDAQGYSGAEFCLVCHRDEHQAWALTNHAYAFDSLVEHGEDRNPECVGCHSVGFDETGGYDLGTRARFLEGVQCENCHGRGGPHQSEEFADRTDFEDVCERCHTPEHSLNFVYDERIGQVSHEEGQELADLDLAERRALIERRDRRSRTLFQPAGFVGSEACRECHEKEHEIWTRSDHAAAFTSLAEDEKQKDAACQKCHTTGFQQPGGFPAGGPSVRGVGCESCHGPGADHVGVDPVTRDGILRLSDKCDSCVILQICGSCHDESNDPGFEFELRDKLELIRHGSPDGPAATAE